MAKKAPDPMEQNPAPDFTLPANGDSEVSLSDFRGRKTVVLYFYPKDNTSGCAREACAFRDNLSALEKRDAVVLGVSRDSIASHDKFVAKLDLPFLLLSDQDETVCELYGVMKEKMMYGKKRRGIERSTFIIDREGIVRKVFRKVKVDGHVEQVLDVLNAIAI